MNVVFRRAKLFSQMQRRTLMSGPDEWTVESLVQASRDVANNVDTFVAQHGVSQTLKLRARCRELLTATTTPVASRDALKLVDDRLRLMLAEALGAERLSVRLLRSDRLDASVAAELRVASTAVHTIENSEQMATRFDSVGKLCFGLFHKEEGLFCLLVYFVW